MENQGFFKQFSQYIKGRLRFIFIPVIILFLLILLIIILTPGNSIGQFVYRFF